MVFIKELLGKNIKDKKYYIIFHKVDTDGQCSGAELRYYLEKEKGIFNPIMIGVDYNENFSFINEIPEGSEVYICDFGFSREIMEYLNKKTILYWYDHHKSAIENNKDFEIKGFRTNKMSACEIIYKQLLEPIIKNNNTNYNYFHITKIIKIISDADNWNKKDYSEDQWDNVVNALSYYIKTFNTSPDSDEGYSFWKEFFEKGTLGGHTLEEILKIGKYIINYIMKMDELKANRCGFETEFEGLRAIVINGASGSQSFRKIYSPEKHDIMISFKINKDKIYSVSLYSEKPDIDVSVIAKKYGGGGHAGASGFSCEKLEFKNGKIQVIGAIDGDK